MINSSSTESELKEGIAYRKIVEHKIKSALYIDLTNPIQEGNVILVNEKTVV